MLARAARRVAAALLSFALAACARPAAGPSPVARAELELAAPHVYGRPSRASAVLRGEDGGPVRGASAAFTGDMTHPGMVPVVAKASETAPGRYEAELTWTMAGDWAVTFEARFPDGSRFETRETARVAAP